MKFRLLPFLLLLPYIAFTQSKTSYYDFFWKSCAAGDATYYTELQNTDSGWLRRDYYLSTRKLQMEALFEDEDCKIYNGVAQYFYANGIPSKVCRYVHGKQEGICVAYHSNGMMSDSGLFHNGRVVDKRMGWHRNGYMADSIARINDSTEVRVEWFDDGRLSGAGYVVNGKNAGKWRFYHHNGQVSANEVYSSGKIVSAEYFDENGKPQMDTSMVNREADFKGGGEAWRKYLEKNLYWPSNLQFSTSAQVSVGLDFAVDENGKIIDAEVSVPFYPQFDAIALNTIKKSPAWLPAIAHNRKIKAFRRQPVTFSSKQD